MVVRIATGEADVLARQVEDHEAVGIACSSAHVLAVGVDKLSVVVVGLVVHLTVAGFLHLLAV